MAMSVTPSSLTNSAVTIYSITMTVPYTISIPVALVLAVPLEISCPSCPSSALNATHHELIFKDQTLANSSYMLTIANMTNFYSREPQTILGAIMSNDLLYLHANHSVRVTTTTASTATYLHSFTVYQLVQPTSLTVSNITLPAVPSKVATIVFTFGNDFGITSVTCANSGYSCANTSSVLTLTNTNPTALQTITIGNILAPALSPSTPITIEIYSGTGYLIARGASIVWSASCSLPCRTCSSSNSSACLTCYSDLTVAQGRVLYSAVNSTCVSVCGDTFYKNYTLNTCEACSSSCLNCANFSLCLSCPSSSYLLASNSTCHSTCPIGFYPHLSHCLACTTSLNCYTCTDSLTCASCLSPYFYHQLSCTFTCPVGTTIANTTTRVCEGCPVNCSTCVLVNSTVQCTGCSAGLLDAGRCVVSC